MINRLHMCSNSAAKTHLQVETPLRRGRRNRLTGPLFDPASGVLVEACQQSAPRSSSRNSLPVPPSVRNLSYELGNFWIVIIAINPPAAHQQLLVRARARGVARSALA